MGLLHYMKRETAVTVHPEISIDNFTIQDADISFFSLIRSIYLRYPIKNVLDYGSGRNYYVQDFDPENHSYFIKDLRDLRFGGANVAAVDVSEAVRTHPTSNSQLQLVSGAPLPFRDATFDLVVSDFVFEHLESPKQLAQELQRVVKPGGWILARTPNRFGYVAFVASLVPNRLHAAVLRYIQPDRKDLDVFPTHYRINTASAARGCFDQCEVSVVSNHWEPQYFFGKRWLYRVNLLIHALLPSSLGMTSIFMMRRN
ncbi:MAG: methyltransferase domain-containing protein [Sphingopyxis sp.]